MPVLTLPSRLSAAVADNVSDVPAGLLAPLAGAVMVTTGGVLPMPIVIIWVAVRPSASVTVAVMTWRPAARPRAVTDGPMPRRPATLDDHLIAADLSPSL